MKDVFVYVSVIGDVEIGYPNLKKLLDTIRSPSKYTTAWRALKTSKSTTVDGVLIKKIPFIPRTKNG